MYGLSLDWIGFLLATILFLMGGFYILGERRWKILLSVSIGFVVVFWYSLTQLLEIYLAPGRLFAGLG
jgi:putative tricarboxylic transport membrane protein